MTQRPRWRAWEEWSYRGVPGKPEAAGRYSLSQDFLDLSKYFLLAAKHPLVFPLKGCTGTCIHRCCCFWRIESGPVLTHDHRFIIVLNPFSWECDDSYSLAPQRNAPSLKHKLLLQFQEFYENSENRLGTLELLSKPLIPKCSWLHLSDTWSYFENSLIVSEVCCSKQYTFYVID